MKFKVKVGMHIEGDEVFRKGDVVESSRPLASLFPGKFEESATPSLTASRAAKSLKEEEWPEPKRKTLK